MPKVKKKRSRSPHRVTKAAEVVIARLTVHSIPDLGTRTRWCIADWLHRLADDIKVNGDDYSKRFTARFWSGRGLGKKRA